MVRTMKANLEKLAYPESNPTTVATLFTLILLQINLHLICILAHICLNMVGFVPGQLQVRLWAIRGPLCALGPPEIGIYGQSSMGSFSSSKILLLSTTSSLTLQSM